VVNCNRFSYQQVIHILHSSQASFRYWTRKGKRASQPNCTWLSYPKSVHPVKTDTSMTRIKKSQSSPLIEGILDKELILSRSTFKGHKSTNLQPNNYGFRLSLLVVGKRVYLVMLWPNPARRDKPGAQISEGTPNTILPREIYMGT